MSKKSGQRFAKKIDDFENILLDRVNTELSGYYVQIPYNYKNEQSNCDIWTISANTNANLAKTPIVLLHGYMSGVASWAFNIDALSKSRPLYAIDLIGFGKSSRPKFSSDPIVAENQFVDSIEEWRKAVKLDKFILLGHSFGGYLSSAYALKYSQNLVALILEEPWGFPHASFRNQYKNHYKICVYSAKSFFKSLKLFLINKEPALVDNYKDLNQYYKMYLNFQTPRTGEKAFRSSFLNKFLFSCSKRPMIDRFERIEPNLLVWFIFADQSWSDVYIGDTLSNQRPSNKSFVKVIDFSDHMAHFSNNMLFNEQMRKILNEIDSRLNVNK